jgi:flagellin
MVFALNTGGTSTEQIAAEQDAVNYAVSAIKRIVDITKFGTTRLLDGDSSLYITSMDTEAILEVRPLSVQFDPTTNVTVFEVRVMQCASQASMVVGAAANSTALAVSGGDVTIRVQGPLGAQEINLLSGTVASQVIAAVNLLRGNLGIYGSAALGTIYTEDFGEDATISITHLGGEGVFLGAGGLQLGERYVTRGSDAVASIGGERASARGNHLEVVNALFTGTVELNPNTNQDPIRGPGSEGTYHFAILRSGLTFQFGAYANANEQKTLGLPNLSPTFLGSEPYTLGGLTFGGRLTTVTAGGENDLFTNPANGMRIVDAAIMQVSDARAYLGAFVHDMIEPNIRSLEVAIENLTASESELRDLDFAAEVAEMTKTQILFQAGISVLAQANLIPQAVLQLLQ